MKDMICQEDWDFVSAESDSVRARLTKRKRSAENILYGLGSAEARSGSSRGDKEDLNHIYPRADIAREAEHTQVPEPRAGNTKLLFTALLKNASFLSLCFPALSFSRLFFLEVLS